MKTIKVLAIVLLAVIILPFLAYSTWLIKKGHALDVMVINKFMTRFQGSENESFNYILNSKKLHTFGNRSYKLDVDNTGLIWNKGDYRINYPRLKDVERTVEKTNMVYYADASGIMTSQLKGYNEKQENKLEYGGLNHTDYILLKQLISLGKTLVVEHNFFGPPTDPLIRYNIEKLTDIYYIGWVGKYINDFSDNTDKDEYYNWKVLYKIYNGQVFSSEGSGIVLINEEAHRIVILKEGIDINTKEGLIRSGKEAMKKFNLPSATNYNGWFTFLHPGQNEVLSKFTLNPSEKGQDILNEAGIPDTFPALIQFNTNCYYLAGDFGKCKVRFLMSKLPFIRPLYDALKRSSKNSNNFFYSYYQPFMTSIVNESIELNKQN